MGRHLAVSGFSTFIIDFVHLNMDDLERRSVSEADRITILTSCHWERSRSSLINVGMQRCFEQNPPKNQCALGKLKMDEAGL